MYFYRALILAALMKSLVNENVSLIYSDFINEGQTISFSRDLLELHAYSYQNSLVGSRLNSFSPGLVKAMASEWSHYFNKLSYPSYGWTLTSSFKYPF